MRISWTPAARNTYFNILEYLEETWTEKEIRQFIKEVDKVLIQISRNPEMFEASRIKRDIRKGIITKHTTLYYRIIPEDKELQLLVFWDNRQDPDKLAL